MTRIVKEYAIRRDEILDSAQKLIYSKGFEQMTIQDILDDLSIAKGTFYHYFDSKQALLEAITRRTLDRAEQAAAPIVDAPQLGAPEKLRRFFSAMSRWESDQQTLILALLEVWYHAENAVVREQTRSMTVERLAPLLNRIVRQGVDEGTLAAAHPDQAGEIALFILMGMEDHVVGPFMLARPEPGDLARAEAALAAYQDAAERVLGAPAGTLTIITPEALRSWAAARK